MNSQRLEIEVCWLFLKVATPGEKRDRIVKGAWDKMKEALGTIKIRKKIEKAREKNITKMLELCKSKGIRQSFGM